MAVQRVGKLRFSLGHCVVVVIGICVSTVPISHSYLTSVWQLDTLASTASVLATVRVEQTGRDNSVPQSLDRTVLARADLLVIRAYPPSILLPGQHIRLEYEQLPEGRSLMSGPDVPPLKSGAIWVVPLKPNPKPQAEAWRLVADEGIGTIIPAVEADPPFSVQPKNKREYLLVRSRDCPKHRDARGDAP